MFTLEELALSCSTYPERLTTVFISWAHEMCFKLIRIYQRDKV